VKPHLRIKLATALLLMLLIGISGGLKAQSGPCCGPIDQNGQRLARLLDGTGVDHLWLRGWHVNWETGAPDREAPGGPEAKTHCSAFVAAIAERLGIYVLRPPQHPQNLLANAQMRWLREDGQEAGWSPVAGPREAQALANKGELVLAVWENPNPHRPGHIAIIRPSERTDAQLAAEGPEETQSGTKNYLATTVSVGFRSHPKDELRYFAHPIAWPEGAG
jgi:hypothetical protein